jgi:peptidoglycan/LPS O-acetylase OafA/YrhL
LFQQRCELDGRIGDLSYPIYINHVLTFHLCGYSLKKLGVHSDVLIATGGVVVSIAFAILLNTAVAGPIERLRRRIKKANSAAPSEVSDPLLVGAQTEPPDMRDF